MPPLPSLAPTLSPTPPSQLPCKLLGGAFAYFIQLLLGVMALSALFVKRCRERPQRPLKVFLYDASKQALIALVAHLFNMLVALLLKAQTHEDAAIADECGWYFLNFTLDTTLGVALAFAGLQCVEWGARRWARSGSARVRYVCAALQQTGRYGNDPRRPDRNVWLTQCAAWLAIIVLVKLILGFIMLILRPTLTDVADNLFLGLRMSAGWKAELAIVMVLCPLGMNMVQFWIQDTFLKADKRRRGPRRCCACCRRGAARDAYDPAATFGGLDLEDGGGDGGRGRDGVASSSKPAAVEKARELEIMAASAVASATRSLEDSAAQPPPSPPSPIRAPRRTSDLIKASPNESLLVASSSEEAAAGVSDLTLI